MNAQKLFMLFLYILIVISSETMAKQFTIDKREQNPARFKTMMRYGRSGITKNLDAESKVNVRPRADAFFLGPRYGKRSSWNPNNSLVYSVPLCGTSDENLSCVYTGILDLYQCTLRRGRITEQFSTSN